MPIKKEKLDSIKGYREYQKKSGADKEFTDIVEICQQQGYITVKDMSLCFRAFRHILHQEMQTR